MFRRWFELQGKMPLKVDRTCGHIDRFVEIMFRPPSTSSTPGGDRRRPPVRKAVPGDLADRAARLQAGRDPARAIRWSGDDKALIKIFRVIEQDEPSHWAPYDGWLKAQRQARAQMVGARDRQLHPFRAAVPQAADPVPQPVAASGAANGPTPASRRKSGRRVTDFGGFRCVKRLARLVRTHQRPNVAPKKRGPKAREVVS